MGYPQGPQELVPLCSNVGWMHSAQFRHSDIGKLHLSHVPPCIMQKVVKALSHLRLYSSSAEIRGH